MNQKLFGSSKKKFKKLAPLNILGFTNEFTTAMHFVRLFYGVYILHFIAM